MVVFAIIIGLFTAYTVIGFRYLLIASRDAFYLHQDTSLDNILLIPWAWRLTMPIVGGLLVGLITTYLSNEVGGSGVPLVINAVKNRGGVLHWRIIPLKILAVICTIGSGGSAGRQGPVVHVGATIGSFLSQIARLPARHTRTFVACGASAAIAATFNAPMGGVLFAIEVLMVELKVAGMAAVVIASVVATVISRHYMGDLLAFSIPSFSMESPWELLSYALMGVVVALVAVIFMKMFVLMDSLFDNSPMPKILRPVLGGLFVGLIALLIPHILMLGTETMGHIMWGRFSISLLLLILLAKIVATPLTISSGGSGGIFLPSLMIGATLGAAWGKVTDLITPFTAAISGAYALVGMGALFAAVAHAPITAVLLVFEMTNNYRIIPALMVSSVIAFLLSSWIHPTSIYQDQLRRRGFKEPQPRGSNILKEKKVADVLSTDIAIVHSSDTLLMILSVFLSKSTPSLIVTDENGRYAGNIEFNDIREFISITGVVSPIVCAVDILNSEVPFVVPGDTLDFVMHLFGRNATNIIAVVNNDKEQKFIGVISRSTIIDSYNKQMFDKELSDGFESIVSTVSDNRSIEILGNIYLSEIYLKADWIGKTIRDINLRASHGLQILLIHKSADSEGVDGREGVFPTPETILQLGDKLLVMGEKEKIHHFTGE